MTVKDRLKKIIESNGLTISGFEKSISVTNGYVNSISKNIGIDKIEKILAMFPNINLEWLLLGKGEMIIQNTQPINHRIQAILELSKEDQEKILDTIDALILHSKNKK